MFRGSLIDSEFQGLSTIEIMNVLAPDVVTIGNHEADYGLAHLLFIGIITEEVLKNTKSEGLVGTLIDVTDAAEESARSATPTAPRTLI